jgi:HJR/Mrr/RecB family endonuclease
MFDQANTKKQGDVGLGQAIAWFTRNSYTVSLPLTDSQDYDLIVDKDNVLYRVQVKTTSNKNNF